ncbi:hypothetical protein [Candidiatus Paracoxiella cheracis]|uniref:hypothetical protein n=1 Tax=Candidiatus Paracoxiella cheracis TaxID=3405120 RepID=UPI003BF466ED
MPQLKANENEYDMQETQTQLNPKSKREIIAWCIYDWANSAFPTLILTFIFSTYFTEKIAINEIVGTSQCWTLGKFIKIIKNCLT